MNPIVSKIKNFVFGGGGTFIEKVGKAIDDNFSNKEEILKAKAEIEKVHSDYEIAISNIALEHAKLEVQKEIAYLQDVANARAMQIEALKNQDAFSKRFIYYFTIGLTSLTMLYNFMFFFVEYPERNHDLINMIAGVLNTGCLISIINFFYGSSKSSEKKQEAIEKMASTK